MKYFTYLFICIFFTSSLYSDVTIGITIYSEKDNPRNMRKIKRVVSEVFNDINKIQNTKANVLFLDYKDSVIDEFENQNKFDILMTYSSFYLKNKERLKNISKEPFIFTKDEKQKVQMILIANKSSNIKSIKDIKNKTYASYINASVANMWLDFKSRKVLKKSYKKLVNRIYMVRKHSRRVLDVYFKKADFTIVPDIVYKDMLLLNPALKKELLIVDKSRTIFYYMVGLFHKNTKKSIINKIDKIISNEINNKKLTQIFKAIEIFHLYNSSFEELEEMENFYDEYRELVKETGG